MGIWLLINYIVLTTAVIYFAYRLGYNIWVFAIISLIFSPIVGFLSLAIWDYYQTFMKGNR